MNSTRFESIEAYNDAQADEDRAICMELRRIIDANLPGAESRVWHGHPVWFLDGNPIVGYSKPKGDVQLLFWSGQSFSTPGLVPEGTFKAAGRRYAKVTDIDEAALKRWLDEAKIIQWDYKSIVRNKGRLDRLS